MTLRGRTALVLFVVLLPAPAPAVELVIEYAALQRIVAQELFTQDGRKYVRGSHATHCSFAYLENPRIDADGDRLRIQARFTGRTAADLFGACIGLGDAFDLSITAIPYYHDGLIGFRGVQVNSVGRDGFYIRRVCNSMTQSLSRDFQYHLFDDARRVLEQKVTNAPYVQNLRDFQAPRVRVTGQGLVLTLEFGLVVK
jgi:hypothetical protein